MELTNSQKLVINTKNKSLLVSASAGSGKTFVVVERIVESIKAGRDISTMLILTFTNAAASELKERIVNKLYDVKDEYIKLGDKENAKRIAKQISLVPSSDVSTIHSFCLSTIRNNFYTLGIDPNITTLEEPKSTLMLGECIEELLEEEFENKDEAFLDILDMQGNEEQLVETLFRLYKAYIGVADKKLWLDKILSIYETDKEKIRDLTETEFGKQIVESIRNTLEIEALELERIIDKLDGVEDFSTRKDALKVILDRINVVRECKTYNEIFSLVDILLAFPTMPRTKVSDNELKEEVSDIKTKVTDKLRGLVKKLIYKNTSGIIEELNSSLKYAKWYTSVLERIDSKYTSLKKEKGVIDFSDYEHLTLEALKDDNIKEKYKEKYEEIYIDEYQDTSDIQETILMSIARLNNVIMVGDVKQSIYGFRNAAPELFSEKYDRLEEIEVEGEKENLNEAKIILAQNFRSRKDVINATNEVFGKLMSDTFGGAKYGEKEKLIFGAAYPDSESYKAELHIVERPETEEDDENKYQDETKDIIEELVIDKSSLELEATAVGKRIQELVNGEFKVYDLKKAKYRPCEYKDIVILMSKVEKVGTVIADTLGSMGIPTYTDAKTGFYKSDEISLVISFLKILNNKLDDISLASVLYSIIGKFTLDDLVKIRKGTANEALIISLNKYLEDEEREEAIKCKIDDFFKLLERFNIYLKTYNLHEVVLKLYEETGIYESMRFETLGTLKCANLDAFVQIVADFEKSESISQLYLLLKYLDVLKAKESGGDSPKLLGENENVVRIMTMHKSKGLEFPVVIIMNTASKYNEMDLRNKTLTSSKYGMGIDIYDKEKGVTYPSVIKQVIKQDARKKLRSEALRLLYVAFTRAKEKLIIFGNVPKSLETYTKGMFEAETKVSDAVAFTHSSHLKCILQAIYGNEQHISIVRHNVASLVDSEGETNISRKSKIDEFKDKVESLGIKENIEAVNKLKEKLTVKYGYEIDVEQKYTATKLAKKNSTTLLLSDLKPMSLDNTVTGTNYGTFIHSIIENLDFANVTKEAICEVVKTRTNALNLGGKVNINKVAEQIYKLYERHLKQFIIGAKKIQREYEFVFEDDLKTVPEVALKAPSLIQGVIDMYVVTKDNNHIIIDFKTDNVENKEELIDRYKVQLEVYKRAIEVCFEAKVDAVYIYSFKLDEMIKV